MSSHLGDIHGTTVVKNYHMANRGLIPYTHAGKQSIVLQTASGQLLYDMYDKYTL